MPTEKRNSDGQQEQEQQQQDKSDVNCKQPDIDNIIDTKNYLSHTNQSDHRQ